MLIEENRSVLVRTQTFFPPKVKNSMTTNDSEVIIAGCQWIGICQSEKTVCPSSIFPQTDWQPVSAASV